MVKVFFVSILIFRSCGDESSISAKRNKVVDSILIAEKVMIFARHQPVLTNWN